MSSADPVAASRRRRVVMQLIPQDKGEMLFDGEIVGGQALTLKEYRRQAQMVFRTPPPRSTPA